MEEVLAFKLKAMGCLFDSPGEANSRQKQEDWFALRILYIWIVIILWSDYLQKFCSKNLFSVAMPFFLLFFKATEKVNFLSHIHNFYNCKLHHGQLAQSKTLLVLLFHLPVSRIQSPLNWRIFFFQLFYNLVDTGLYKNTAYKL